jgi:hypothetical protein
MPALDDVRRKYQPRGFEVVGIALDSTPKQISEFLDQHKVSYPILVGTDKTVPALGKLEALPTSLLLDAKGGVLSVLVGALDIKTLTEEIDQAFAAPGTSKR